jgi:LysR family transcriptional regulator, transcriptional activator for aaeXAB operon
MVVNHLLFLNVLFANNQFQKVEQSMIKHIRHMVVFSHVVECGSVSAAATKLNVAKSVVSQQLKVLEGELGVALLNRSTRSNALTAAGKAFYAQCRQISDIANSAWTNARESQRLALGSICISAPNALIEPIIAPALGELVEQNEGIYPTLLSDDSRVHLLEDKVDLAIRVGRMTSSEYKQRKLGSFRDVLCASPGYLAKHGVTPAWLHDQQHRKVAVHYVANRWQGTHIQHRLTHKKSKKVIQLAFDANRLCNSLPAVVEMTRAGCGFAFIPDFVFNRYKQSQALVEVMPDYNCDSAAVYAVHAFNGGPPTIVNLVIEAIKNKIAAGMAT